MKQIFSSAVLVFSFSICAAAQTSVEELLEKVDLLYRSNSSHATMEMKIVTENSPIIDTFILKKTSQFYNFLS